MVTDAAGGRQTALADVGDLSLFTWSPDGQWMLSNVPKTARDPGSFHCYKLKIHFPQVNPF